jgi:hypothetical protein
VCMASAVHNRSTSLSWFSICYRREQLRWDGCRQACGRCARASAAREPHQLPGLANGDVQLKVTLQSVGGTTIQVVEPASVDAVIDMYISQGRLPVHLPGASSRRSAMSLWHALASRQSAYELLAHPTP